MAIDTQQLPTLAATARVSDSVAAGTIPQPTMPAAQTGTQPVPLTIGAPRSASELLSPEQVQSMRTMNTKQNLRSNFWFDVSGYLRWASTITLMGCLAIVGNAVAGSVGAGGIAAASMGTVMTGIGVGLASSAFGICLLAGVGLAIATVAASRHSRRIFTEKSFDVQDFQMQRQAALIGKTVERAVDDPSRVGHQPRWADQVLAARTAAPEPEAHPGRA